MERIIKVVLILFLLLQVSLPAKADETIPLTAPQMISFEQCLKRFNINAVRLFELTLAGINANKFEINEIQSRQGYLVFTAAQKKYLATVVNLSENQSILKITPTDNNYYFPYGVVSNIFKYIEMFE